LARYLTYLFTLFVLVAMNLPGNAQVHSQEKVKKAGKRVEKGYEKQDMDTLAQGYFDLGESYYEKGELTKSETYFIKSRDLFTSQDDPEGIAKSSRALAKVQEDLNKKAEAIQSYNTSQIQSERANDRDLSALNMNDVSRLSRPDSLLLQAKFLNENIVHGLSIGDTGEVVVNYSRIGDLQLRNNAPVSAIGAFNNAYELSRGVPDQARKFNQLITDVYLGQNDYSKAIATKKEILNESFVKNSTELKAKEIASLANIYLLKKEDSTAIRLLNESYALSLENGHTVQAMECIEKLDSIYRIAGRRDVSLDLYKNFLSLLPGIIAKDSSLLDSRMIAATELRIMELETEKAMKDDEIRRKNIFNYWLIGSLGLLALFVAVVLFMLRKLRNKNKKIALQSLRREMNPHFIFNSLNSINQFIATRNELEANQYLSKFSVLMRRVMENSKDDFVQFSNEMELLQNYLELERSRFPDKFDFSINVSDELWAIDELYVPGMLIQPHLENAIWHGLRYIEGKGKLYLDFKKDKEILIIEIEDNGIGIKGSRSTKTTNQKQHKGRGISNTQERIKILNELYHLKISCEVVDKPAPDRGVRVVIRVPILNEVKHEN